MRFYGSSKTRKRHICDKIRYQNAVDRNIRRRKRQKEEKDKGIDLKQVARTIESQRLYDETAVESDDEEIIGDELTDEFQPYISGNKKVKIMMTTRPKPSRKLFYFVSDLMTIFPNSYYYPRNESTVEGMYKTAVERNFSHVIVFGEKSKACNWLMISVLPFGPTAMFNVSNYTSADAVKVASKYESVIQKGPNPLSEVFISRFKSRLGRRLGRLLKSCLNATMDDSLVPSNLITFHNQRDFIFFRHHEMDPSTADKHEIGPRFTLKLSWLKAGKLTDSEGTEFSSHRFKMMRKDVGWKRKFML